MEQTIRRYDLDWLRVIAFGLLIIYHTGMFFVSWSWHIKNNEITYWIKWPMLFLNQWRLPLLFIISGMGTYYAFGKRTLKQFIIERYLRLGVPFLFGMLFIVPPQVYMERLSKGQFNGNYWQYFTGPAFQGIYPEGNISWHHLWFILYLLVFSLLLSPLLVQLKRSTNAFIKWLIKTIQKPLGLYVFIIPLYFAEALLEPFFPVTHALINDWFNFINSLYLFFSGFLLISCGGTFWNALKKIKTKVFFIGILAFTIQICIWFFVKDSTLVHFTEALIKVINLWSWILVLFGYAAHFLNRKSNLLSYCNRAVYPFYILHQTITIIIAYYIQHLNWSFFEKFAILALGTFGVSWVIYHFIILNIPLIQPLFGLKKLKHKPI